DEILAEVLLDSLRGWRSTYWKLRRRGSFDFPVLSVAAAARFSGSGAIEEARIVVGSAASRPLVAAEAAKILLGRSLNQETIAEAAGIAARIAKPLDNTDFDMTWRKRVTAEFVTYALWELRGDDVSAERERLTRLPPIGPRSLHSLYNQAPASHHQWVCLLHLLPCFFNMLGNPFFGNSPAKS